MAVSLLLTPPPGPPGPDTVRAFQFWLKNFHTAESLLPFQGDRGLFPLIAFCGGSKDSSRHRGPRKPRLGKGPFLSDGLERMVPGRGVRCSRVLLSGAQAGALQRSRGRKAPI